MDYISLKLGCLNPKEDVVYHAGQVRNKTFYHLKPLTIERPASGIAYDTINCETCGRNFPITVYSRSAVRLKRFSSLGLALLPVTFAVAVSFFDIDKRYFWGGFTIALVIFLALVWMIPVFLPVVFQKESKIALKMRHEHPDHHQHRFFEPNIDSVTRETYY
jgi:hypothetical protein